MYYDNRYIISTGIFNGISIANITIVNVPTLLYLIAYLSEE